VKKVIAGALVLAGLGLVAWSVAVHPWGWLYAVGVHPYPLSSSTPWTYQMWSGIIPALTILTLFGSLGGAYHLHNCHMDGCWRIGKHRVAGTPWCNHHVGNAKPSVSTEDLLLQILAELRQPR
jgi:hypothetical protein